MEIEVHIEGEGVAAACCAQLFAVSGQAFTSARAVRPKLGAVLLSRQTVALLDEIFPAIDLLSVGHPIEKRVVTWGPAAEPITLPHSALVISEADLLTRLWARVPATAESAAGEWKLLSSGGMKQQTFGTRIASVARAVVNRDVDQSACWIESVDSGWLFLLPRGENEAATLIAVGETPDPLLGQSRIVAGLIGALEGPAVEFPAYPRIAVPLCGNGWLACGAAAIGFDPLCGEGTGNAARQAYLATAIIAALRKGEPVEDLLAHYTSRQMHGFLRHLQICLGFYQTAGSGTFWQSETALLQQGIEWAGKLLREQARPPTHRLVGRQLEPIAPLHKE
jgi:2-polyprenyl-6-methoxyphenol hydroxylase-like FAD-dependent oxidoreductase